MKSKNKFFYSSLILACAIFASSLSVMDTSAAEESEILFSGVGHYAFATAGNNNVYRGDSRETASTTARILAPEDNSRLPTNWNVIKDKLISDGYTINNISGSYLDVKGTIKYAEVDYFNLRSSCGYGDTVEERRVSTNLINLILIVWEPAI